MRILDKEDRILDQIVETLFHEGDAERILALAKRIGLPISTVVRELVALGLREIEPQKSEELGDVG